MEHQDTLICLVGTPSVVAATLRELFPGKPMSASPAGPGLPTPGAADAAAAAGHYDGTGGQVNGTTLAPAETHGAEDATDGAVAVGHDEETSGSANHTTMAPAEAECCDVGACSNFAAEQRQGSNACSDGMDGDRSNEVCQHSSLQKNPQSCRNGNGGSCMLGAFSVREQQHPQNRRNGTGGSCMPGELSEQEQETYQNRRNGNGGPRMPGELSEEEQQHPQNCRNGNGGSCMRGELSKQEQQTRDGHCMAEQLDETLGQVKLNPTGSKELPPVPSFPPFTSISTPPARDGSDNDQRVEAIEESRDSNDIHCQYDALDAWAKNGKERNAEDHAQQNGHETRPGQDNNFGDKSCSGSSSNNDHVALGSDGDDEDACKRVRFSCTGAPGTHHAPSNPKQHMVDHVENATVPGYSKERSAIMTRSCFLDYYIDDPNMKVGDDKHEALVYLRKQLFAKARSNPDSVAAVDIQHIDAKLAELEYG